MGRLKIIHKRPGSQNWYARMMVPQPLRTIVGKREFTMSLGTPDRREAEALALPVIAGWKEEVRCYRLGAANDDAENANGDLLIPSSAEIEDAALLVGYEEASRRLNALIASKAKNGPQAFDQMQELFERRFIELCRKQLAGEDDYWRERARRMVAGRHWDLPEHSDGFALLIQQLSGCGLDLFRKAVEGLKNPVQDFKPSEHTQNLARRRKERAKDGEGLMELFDRYAAQRRSEGKKGGDTLTQDRLAVLSFSEFIGPDRSLASIIPADVREWRNASSQLPVGYRKRREFQGLSFKQAIAVAPTLGGKKVSLLTVNKNLSGLSSFFVWAKREGYAETNPCDGLRYDADKRKNPRPPFTVEQLNTILRSPLFTGFAEDGHEHKPGNCKTRDWRFWVPIICLFTGARIGEIAQLSAYDIERHDGHWFIHIRHSERTGQRTKNKKSRIAPIHSTLMKIGFVEFALSQQKRSNKSGETALFPELTLNERGQYGKASRFWRQYLARIGLKDGGDGFGSHSFRHGLTDQLRLAGYHDAEIGVVLGHKQASVTSGYGQLRQGTAARLSEIVDAAKFQGVQFEHLFT